MAGLEGKAKKANTSRTKKGKSRLEKREARYGLLFVLPLIIGVIFFLGSPLIQSFAISLGDINTENGYDIAVRGWENYKRALTVDADYIKYLLESLKETATNTPLIVIVSFVVAMLLKREFPGRTVYRVIFFLPVILTSGVMSEIRTDELIASAIDPMAASEGMTGMLSGSQQVISGPAAQRESVAAADELHIVRAAKHCNRIEPVGHPGSDLSGSAAVDITIAVRGLRNRRSDGLGKFLEDHAADGESPAAGDRAVYRDRTVCEYKRRHDALHLYNGVPVAEIRIFLGNGLDLFCDGEFCGGGAVFHTQTLHFFI